MTPTLLVSLLAFGLAVALARENRVRRALQSLANRLLEKLREADRHEYRHPRTNLNPRSRRHT